MHCTLRKRFSPRYLFMPAALLLAALLHHPGASAGKPVMVRDQSCGDRITQDTILSNDLVGCEEDGLIIDAEGVTLDCNYHEIVGQGHQAWDIHFGVKINGNGVTVRNCDVLHFEYGISALNVSGPTLQHNLTAANFWSGILLDHTTGASVLDNGTIGEGVEIVGTDPAHYDTHFFDRNTVNEGPLVYASHVSGVTIPAGASQVIIANSSNVTVSGQSLVSGTAGVHLAYCEDCRVLANDVSLNKHAGILVEHSPRAIIRENLSSEVFYVGIDLEASDSSEVAGNSVDGSLYGIVLNNSSNNEVAANSVEDIQRVCVFFPGESQTNQVHNNTVRGCSGEGIWLNSCANCEVFDNKVEGSYCGIAAMSGDAPIVQGNSVADNGRGIYVSFSPGCRVEDNLVSQNREFGLRAESCEDAHVSDNVFTGNGQGIWLSHAERALVENNQTTHDAGILVDRSTEVRLEGNTMENGGIVLDGWWDEHFDSHVITGNSANGRDVYYALYQMGGTVPENAEQIILVHAAGVDISGRQLGLSTVPIQVFMSSNVGIGPNRIEASQYGIRLLKTDRSVISGNNISQNLYAGVWLDASDSATLAGNCFWDNGAGVLIESSTDSLLHDNTFRGNGTGIEAYFLRHSTVTGNSIKAGYANSGGQEPAAFPTAGPASPEPVPIWVRGVWDAIGLDEIQGTGPASRKQAAREGRRQGYGFFVGTGSDENDISGNAIIGYPTGMYFEYASDNHVAANWVCYSGQKDIHLFYTAHRNEGLNTCAIVEDEDDNDVLCRDRCIQGFRRD